MARPKKTTTPLKKADPKIAAPAKEYGIFDFLNAVSFDKKDLIRASETPVECEKLYNPFMTNRGLSYHISSIMDANLMNQVAFLDKQLQFDFLISSVRREKRFSKWFKPEANENLELISTVYQCNLRRAQEILSVLSDDQLELIKSSQNTGGRK